MMILVMILTMILMMLLMMMILMMILMNDTDDGTNCGECKYNQCTSKRHWHGCHRRELQKVPVPVNYECLDGQHTHEKIQFAKFASGQEKHFVEYKKLSIVLT